MQFFIDGYNLLFFHLTPDEDLKKNREELISLLDKKFKSLSIKATIIFDGFNQISNQAEHQFFEALTVIFSPKSQTADEYIIEHLSSAKNPNEITVITADKNLAQNARNLGAHCKTPRSFLKEIAKKQSDKEQLKNTHGKDYEDSKANIERLLNLFEKRLQETEIDL
jgi:predicted RNA-binding protein with PIN domain